MSNKRVLGIERRPRFGSNALFPGAAQVQQPVQRSSQQHPIPCRKTFESSQIQIPPHHKCIAVSQTRPPPFPHTLHFHSFHLHAPVLSALVEDGLAELSNCFSLCQHFRKRFHSQRITERSLGQQFSGVDRI